MHIKQNPTPKNFTPTYVIKKVISTNIGPFHLENHKEINTESETSEVLNDYFASVFTVEDIDEIQEITPAKPNLIPLSDCHFTEDTVTKALDNIKMNKTSNPDSIAPRVLKEATYQISKSLAILFNKPLNSGKVPDIWKLANVTPIQKKGNKRLPINYRPISLT